MGPVPDATTLRWAFLNTVRERCPDAVIELRDAVAPVTDAVCQVTNGDPLERLKSAERERVQQELGKLDPVARKWVRRWNLDAPWIVGTVRRSARAWATVPDRFATCDVSRLAWLTPAAMWEPVAPPSAAFTYAPWDPNETRLSPSAYKRTVLAKLEAQLAKEVRDAQESIKNQGLLDHESKPEREKHLCWLVDYQVREWSPKKIAQEWRIEREVEAPQWNSVQKEVTKMAGLLGVPRRPSKRGPRRKT